MLLLTLGFLHGSVSSLKATLRATRPESSAPSQSPPAEVKIRKLKPSDFRELPRKISKELDRRGCAIPQLSIEGYETKEPHNVASGEFARKGQKDWAVLCSRRGRSVILIFWGRPTKCSSVINSGPDIAERYIGTVDAKYILDHYEGYGGPKPPPLEHQGLNVGFAEKGSEVMYCYRGKWRVLQGAD